MILGPAQKVFHTHPVLQFFIITEPNSIITFFKVQKTEIFTNSTFIFIYIYIYIYFYIYIKFIFIFIFIFIYLLKRPIEYKHKIEVPFIALGPFQTF
jgi:hypothetical protein